MQQKIYQIDRTDSAKLIARYTIGFLKLSTINQEEDAKYAGSGVLVSVGNMLGVLTAAHVLDVLPKDGPVGLVDFSGLFQKIIMPMKATKRFSMGNFPWSENGPDIAFLLLPIEFADILKGKLSFLNLILARDNFNADSNKTAQFFDVALGGLGRLEEGTRDVKASVPNYKSKIVEGRALFGNTAPKAPHVGMDLLQFTPEQSVDFTSPKSFEGISGGGLWRIYLDLDEAKNVKCNSPQLIGIAFYQLDEGTIKHSIVCHGPKSIYESFYQKLDSELNSNGTF